MIEILLYIVFVLSAIVLIIVVLLQEGRGGGFGQALGEHGQQTFGVAASGIHKFTLGVAGVFLASAVLIHALGRNQTSGSVLTTISPADPTGGADPTGK
jgi:preprotein translocase subunit SecG